MSTNSSGESAGTSNPTRTRIAETDPNQTASVCSVVAVDHTNIYYTVCAGCERTLPDPNPNPNPNSPSPVCTRCSSSASKRLFRILMSVATDTDVFVVILFDRAARVLFGCSADEFFGFTKTHPFAAENAGKVLEGEMLRVTLSQPKNGNARHPRVVSIVPLRSGFQPIITTLKELYK